LIPEKWTKSAFPKVIEPSSIIDIHRPIHNPTESEYFLL
jgi:hypothetical protein